jgi:thioredoxin-related protein
MHQSLINNHIQISLCVMRTSTISLSFLAAVMFCAASLQAAEMVMVEEIGCPWCAKWHREIGPIYPKTEEGKIAPLRTIDISDRDPDTFDYAKRVVFTPTFVLVDEGRELGRLEGYAGDEFFWVMLSQLLKDNNLTTGETQ